MTNSDANKFLNELFLCGEKLQKIGGRIEKKWQRVTVKLLESERGV